LSNEPKGPRIFYGWFVLAACFAATFTLVERPDCHKPPFKHVADEAANEYLSSLDLMFPDHDSLMSENYPEVAKDVTRLA